MNFLQQQRPILMGVLNLTPDSFFAPSRACSTNEILSRLQDLLGRGCTIIDVGAVSTRPGATRVSVEQEWGRLAPALPVIRQWLDSQQQAPVHQEAPCQKAPAHQVPLAHQVPIAQPEATAQQEPTDEQGPTAQQQAPAHQVPIAQPEATAQQEPTDEQGPTAHQDRWISIDTFRSEIVRQAYDFIGPFIVNDISAGEDDPAMLRTVAELGLPYIAMHKRGNPQNMDSLTHYPQGVTDGVKNYFSCFLTKAAEAGLQNIILDPGFGFAKTSAQNWELLHNLKQLKRLGKPLLAGVADKRFTKDPLYNQGDPKLAERIAAQSADILRIH